MKKLFIDFIANLPLQEDVAKNAYLVEEKINNLKCSEELRELIIYFVDDYYIQKYNIKWIDYMMEYKFYQMRIGGERFFDNLNKYLKTSNMEYIEYYALAISFGFLGKYTQISEIVENQTPSLLWIIFIFILCVITINLVDYYCFRYKIFHQITQVIYLLYERI